MCLVGFLGLSGLGVWGVGVLGLKGFWVLGCISGRFGWEGALAFCRDQGLQRQGPGGPRTFLNLSCIW